MDNRLTDDEQRKLTYLRAKKAQPEEQMREAKKRAELERLRREEAALSDARARKKHETHFREMMEPDDLSMGLPHKIIFGVIAGFLFFVIAYLTAKSLHYLP